MSSEPAQEKPQPPQHRHSRVLKPPGILLALAAVAALAYFGYAFLKQMGTSA